MSDKGAIVMPCKRQLSANLKDCVKNCFYKINGKKRQLI